MLAPEDAGRREREVTRVPAPINGLLVLDRDAERVDEPSCGAAVIANSRTVVTRKSRSKYDAAPSRMTHLSRGRRSKGGSSHMLTIQCFIFVTFPPPTIHAVALGCCVAKHGAADAIL